MNDEREVDRTAPAGSPSTEDARLDRLLREWAERPPQTNARQAADRLIGQLTARRRGRTWRWLSAAAALLLVTVTAWQLAIHRPSEGETTGGATSQQAEQWTPARQESPKPDADLLVIPLDSKTTLYLSMAAPIAKKGNPT